MLTKVSKAHFVDFNQKKTQTTYATGKSKHYLGELAYAMPEFKYVRFPAAKAVSLHKGMVSVWGYGTSQANH